MNETKHLQFRYCIRLPFIKNGFLPSFIHSFLPSNDSNPNPTKQSRPPMKFAASGLFSEISCKISALDTYGTLLLTNQEGDSYSYSSRNQAKPQTQEVRCQPQSLRSKLSRHLDQVPVWDSELIIPGGLLYVYDTVVCFLHYIPSLPTPIQFNSIQFTARVTFHHSFPSTLRSQ